jgi:hypothetical protein
LDDNGNPYYKVLNESEFEFDSVQGRVRLDPRGPNPENPDGWTIIGPNRGSGAGPILMVAGTAAAADGPEPFIGDLVAVFIAGYAAYRFATHETFRPPTIFNNENKEEPKNSPPATPQPDAKDITDKVGKIAEALGVTPKQVKEAIHAAKKNLPKSGPVRNPDVEVDIKTGEIYPKIPGGGRGDSIGNIFDYLK